MTDVSDKNHGLPLLMIPLVAFAFAPQTVTDLTSVERVVKVAYANEFAETIVRPAMFVEMPGGRCRDMHLTTTAYFRNWEAAEAKIQPRPHGVCDEPRLS